VEARERPENGLVPEHLQTQPPTHYAESLSGLIERVTFHNEDTGFAVLKVKAKGHRDLVSVVGSLASVSPGEWVTGGGPLDTRPGVRPAISGRDADQHRPNHHRGH
jgi:hypothetical protein